MLLIRKLYQIGLFSPLGWWRILRAVWSEGINLMTLLRIATLLHPKCEALQDDDERLGYAALYQQSRNLCRQLRDKHGIVAGQKIAVACRNHAAMLRAMFAVSRLGAHVYLVNPEMSAEQLKNLLEKYKIHFLIYDNTLETFAKDLGLGERVLSEAQVNEIAKGNTEGHFRLRRTYSGQLVVLTGGTTGTPKAAGRKPSVFKFLAPFFALLTQVDLNRYKSVYIATPAYHGFGVASVFVSMILGAKMFFTRRFDAAKGCALIREQQIEVVTLVPVMLQRLIDSDVTALASIQRFITGGAPLSPRLAVEVLEKAGERLFNMYGTSEAGFCVMATPQDLCRYPNTIGRPIAGVRLRLLDSAEKPVAVGAVGRICIKSSWTISGKNMMETGDLATQNADGLLFLCGRNDDMIVSGGENVYPIELENVLCLHPDIAQIAAIGISDAEFGQRLKAFVVLKPNALADSKALLAWLKPRVARFQMPAVIEFCNDLPLTAIGKVNKKTLREKS